MTDAATTVPPSVAAAGPPPVTVRQRWFRPSRPRSFGLRNRILLIFALGSLGLSAVLAVTTYGLVRTNLLSQRESATLETSYRNALTAQRALRGQVDASSARSALESLDVEAPIVYYNGEYPPINQRFTQNEIPSALQQRVIDENTPARMVASVGGDTYMVVGIPLTKVGGAYFEFFNLEEDNRTLSNVALSLLLAAIITTLLGVGFGIIASNRAVRPVAAAAQAAKSISGGRLDTRLEPTDDPDLSVLATSFNEMASGLQSRVERDARFASDVSHELRSPLMTLLASVEVMESRRDEMPERAQAALDLLSSDVVRFQGLVEDLLEISRFDAGAVRLNLDELLAAEFVRQAVAVSSLPSAPVTVSPRAESAIIEGDRRRLARVIHNLIDNAQAHADGQPSIAITEADAPDEPLSHLLIAVEDGGPGVPEDERQQIFERFARGTSAAGRRSDTEGAGLGLSLVAEHVHLHGGRVWVEDRLDGEQGARFVIELLATELEA